MRNHKRKPKKLNAAMLYSMKMGDTMEIGGDTYSGRAPKYAATRPSDTSGSTYSPVTVLFVKVTKGIPFVKHLVS